MAQSNIVMAFRKRLAKYGYRNISIVRDEKKKRYQIVALEPLAGKLVKTWMDEYQMFEAFR